MTNTGYIPRRRCVAHLDRLRPLCGPRHRGRALRLRRLHGTLRVYTVVHVHERPYLLVCRRVQINARVQMHVHVRLHVHSMCICTRIAVARLVLASGGNNLGLSPSFPGADSLVGSIYPGQGGRRLRSERDSGQGQGRRRL